MRIRNFWGEALRVSLLPWRHVNSWVCTACGECCRGFKVVLKPEEWLTIVEKYGIDVTEVGSNKLYLKRRADGSCIFLYRWGKFWLCGLQQMKPKACKLWPFKILSWPKYGNARKAAYRYMGRILYVYVDPFCPGVKVGVPSKNFVNKVLPEFIEIALGLRTGQEHSTSKLPEAPSPPHPLYLRAKGRIPL